MFLRTQFKRSLFQIRESEYSLYNLFSNLFLLHDKFERRGESNLSFLFEIFDLHASAVSKLSYLRKYIEFRRDALIRSATVLT